MWSRSVQLLEFFVILLAVARTASGADRFFASDSGTSFAKLADPVSKARFPAIPFRVERGIYFVAWSEDPLFKGESVFGACELNGNEVVSWFPWRGKEWKNPPTWSLLEDGDYFWGTLDKGKAKPDCSNVEGGEPLLIGGMGAVNINRAIQPRCSAAANGYAWTVGKWRDKTTWFGCKELEFAVALEDLNAEDVFFLCAVKSPPQKTESLKACQ
ncbi:hypothetical protein BSKO_06447 [Bryopsis sp. KO-2023]|nr:hypothetical protein BSKO_06447 [Bryopsis sp. KO-2023]